VLYEVGLTGIPVYNVHNNCSTGSSGVHMMYNLISGGIYDCTLVVGFDKMEKGKVVILAYAFRIADSQMA
jgi:sterol carrier protein 2